MLCKFLIISWILLDVSGVHAYTIGRIEPRKVPVQLPARRVLTSCGVPRPWQAFMGVNEMPKVIDITGRKTACVSEWAEKAHLPKATVYARLRAGWSDADSIQPVSAPYIRIKP